MTEQFLDRMGAVSQLLASHAGLLVLLSVIDGARSFMTGGSSYLFPDLFHKVGDCGPKLNLLASVAPLIGLATCYFCNDYFTVGTKPITIISSIIATLGLSLL